MKNVNYLPLSLLLLFLIAYGSIDAQERDCQRTCMVTKTVAQGGFIGASVKPVCGEDGLKIIEVVPNTFADKSGLMPGDIIYEVNGDNVHFTREIKAILAELTPKDEVEIKYLRKSTTNSVEGHLGAKEYVEVEVEECCDGSFSVNNVQIGPNPTSGVFTLQFDALVKEPSLSIQIFDLEGKEVVVEELLNFKGRYNKEYNLSGKGSGLYLLEISNGLQKRHEKIMLAGI